jgi:hypothetical protein
MTEKRKGVSRRILEGPEIRIGRGPERRTASRFGEEPIVILGGTKIVLEWGEASCWYMNGALEPPTYTPSLVLGLYNREHLRACVCVTKMREFDLDHSAGGHAPARPAWRDG